MSTKDDVERIRGLAGILDSRPFGHDEILRLLQDIVTTFSRYLPAAKLEEKRNNKWVCNFGIKGIPLVMVERVHGSRDAIPRVWRKRMINAVEEVLDLVESQGE